VFRPPLTELAKRFAPLTAPADATDKLLRYEAHLDRQLYRAMDQLERLQRQRRGETVPPSAEHQLRKREIAVFTKQSQQVLYYQQKQRKTEVASQARERTNRYLGRIKDKD
jgi:hypothetical protein